MGFWTGWKGVVTVTSLPDWDHGPNLLLIVFFFFFFVDFFANETFADFRIFMIMLLYFVPLPLPLVEGLQKGFESLITFFFFFFFHLSLFCFMGLIN